jgi:hypothetical protein
MRGKVLDWLFRVVEHDGLKYWTLNDAGLEPGKESGCSRLLMAVDDR